MKPLKQLCKPRPTVFDPSKRDIVLDVTDLVEDKINAEEFFEENYITDGMTTLLREAFRRFEQKSAQGIFKLTQAMGGGKTHNLIVLGLLAKHPEFREKVMGHIYQPSNLGPVRVVAFTGRQSDVPYGVWGSIAEQLGKKDVFKDYYSPLKAPGQSAWINLLKGEPLLILLDELPPYLQYAKSQPIGNSDLSEVTTTALSNLLVAVGKDELSNVAVVISDLRAAYADGTQQISRALQNLENEVGRSALSLEPVGMNTDELYHILRKRLFIELPDEGEIKAIADGYAKAVKDAKQMDITNASPEKFAQMIRESYPFHPAIRDLYARFRENPGFQQTRGLIRLMRVVVSRLYNEKFGTADKKYLIAAHDIDLNDRETLAEITQINPTLENAISHDIASNGSSVAENMDANLGGTDAQDVCKLILISSLANVPNALLGLSVSEIVSYLCAPGRDLSRLPKDVIAILETKAWYMHASKEGKLFFKNVQNLVAKLRTTAESFNRESSLKELRKRLLEIFSPSMKDCYQDVLALPPVDEVIDKIRPDKVTLVIFQPVQSGGLHPELRKLWENLEYRNRILFLTGQKDVMETLLDIAAELKAINFILDEMDSERVPDNDPQRIKANELQDKIGIRLLSATREAFTTLIYPHMQDLMTADFLMNFTDNSYRGEQQIRETLKSKQKFTEDISSESFRRKCEERLFTQKVMLWTEVKKRAATNIKWPWHHPGALDSLKTDLVFKDQWREDGGYVEKPPFERPSTAVRVQEFWRDDNTGTVRLKLNPVHGDIIHYEIGPDVTTGSSKVSDFRNFETSELVVSFLCVDSTGEHETGEPEVWKNRIAIKHRIYQNGDDKMMELKAAPDAPIRYTTDGSNPRNSGGLYEGPFVVPKGTICVLVYAEKSGVSAEERIDISWDGGDEIRVDPSKPAVWKREHRYTTTQESYNFIQMLRKCEASVSGPRVTVAGRNWVELSVDEKVAVTADKLEKTIEHLRGLLTEGQVTIETEMLNFPTGQHLLDWVAEAKTEIKPGEVVQ
jgi:hypothetical protein